MQALILVIHILTAITIIALVLLQHGRGADVGASFGSGASNTMFGSAGSLPFLMKVTAVCAAIFFTTSISLSYLAARSDHKAQMLNMPAMPTAPVSTPATAPASTNATHSISFVPSSVTKDGAKDQTGK